MAVEAIPNELRPGPSGPESRGEGGPFSGLFQDAPNYFGRTHEEMAAPPLLGDLYPENEAEYERILRWCQQAFTAADAAKAEHMRRWAKYYRLYRSYIDRKPGDWHSAIFVPMVFWIIETITPRLVAQLPKFSALPMTADDVESARNMELGLDYAAENSKLFVELVKAFKSSLKYGTGILKTYHRCDYRKARRRETLRAPIRAQVPIPQTGPDGQPMFDMNGDPFVEVREMETGEYLELGQVQQVYRYKAYEGPAAQWVDLGNVWPAPEAEDVQSSRYFIHRVFKDVDEVQRRVKEGIYRWPSNLSIDEITDVRDDPTLEKLMSVGLGMSNDPTRRQLELLEFWTNDGRVITMANRKAILRVQENPFDHSEKPFVRIVDYLQEGEFWGIGEIEPIEGLQDLRNALTNSRVDNIRLLLNAMFFVNYHHVEDMDDFEMKPGGIIKGRGDYRPEEVFQRIDLGDVTGSAFEESDRIDETVEKVTGVNDNVMGDITGGTATESAIATEQGQSRFGMKSKLIEIEGLTDLGRQMASLLQQFMTEEKQIRLGLIDETTGLPAFASLTPESIEGAFDIRVATESVAQSQVVRQEQKMNLLGLVAQFSPGGVKAALSDLLDEMGIKDKDKYLQDPPMMPGQPALPGGQPGSGGGAAGVEEGSAPGGQAGEVPPAAPPQYQSAADGTPGQAHADALIEQIAAEYESGGGAAVGA